MLGAHCVLMSMLLIVMKGKHFLSSKLNYWVNSKRTNCERQLRTSRYNECDSPTMNLSSDGRRRELNDKKIVLLECICTSCFSLSFYFDCECLSVDEKNSKDCKHCERKRDVCWASTENSTLDSRVSVPVQSSSLIATKNNCFLLTNAFRNQFTGFHHVLCY